MLEFLYSITIYPFEILLRALLEAIYSFTGSYGVSIILLSIIVNITLLPLFHLAEKWQRSEQDINARMANKLREIKSAYSGYERHALVSTLYRQYGYKPIFAIKSVAGLLIQIPLFIAAYQFLSHYQAIETKSFLLISDLGEPDRLIRSPLGSINIMPFIMTLVSLISIYIYIKAKGGKEAIQQYLITAIFLVALYTSASALLLYWITSNIFGLAKNLVFRNLRSLNGAKPINLQSFESSRSKTGNSFYWLGLSLMLVLCLISAPLALLASGSPVEFPESLTFYMQPLVGGAIACLFIALPVFISLPRVGIYLFGLVFAFLALGSTLNQYAFSGEYSDMSNFIFERGYLADILDRHKNLLSLFFLGLAIGWLIKSKRSHYLVGALQVCLLASLAFASVSAYQFYAERTNASAELRLSDNKLFELSKTGRNVVIIMMDRMVAGYIPKSLELIPDLEDRLAGFTWYPRSLSPGTYTILGVPTITGGYDYLARTINNDNSGKPLAQRLNEAFRVLPYNFAKAGFDTSLIQPSSYFKLGNKEHLEQTRIAHPFSKYHNYWRQRNGIVPSDPKSVHPKLAYFGLFRSAPLSFRRDIYASGTWAPFTNDDSFTQTHRSLMKQGVWSRTSYYGGIDSERTRAALKNWAIMDDLPLISKVVEGANDQYYYFSNELTHEPWATTPELEIELNNPITYSIEDMAEFKTLSSVQHMYTVAATMKHLSEWFEWLRHNKVYDNTRIIVVSDHGRDVFNPMFNNQGLGAGGRLGTHPNQVSWFHSALLFKDFDANDDFEISETFMTTADVPWMALQGITDGVNPYTNNKIAEPTNKLPWAAAYTPWRLSSNQKSKYSVEQFFLVNDANIFDTENWEAQPLKAPLPPLAPLTNKE